MGKTIDPLNTTQMVDLSALMLRTIEALNILGNSGHINEIEDTISDLEGLTEEEQAVLMPDGKKPRFNYFCAWARTYLGWAGIVERERKGIWTLVDGAALPRSYDEALEMRLRLQREKNQQGKDRAALADLESAGDELPADEQNPRADQWKERLLDTMKAMDPSAFERLAQRILREAGFNKVRVLGKCNDGGIDGVGVLRMNLISFQVYFQCKRWKGSVGSKEIRDFRGALQGRADKGLFITTGTFTAQAYDEATRDGAIAVDLIDGEELCELVEKHQLGVRTEIRQVKQVDVHPDWFASV